MYTMVCFKKIQVHSKGNIWHIYVRPKSQYGRGDFGLGLGDFGHLKVWPFKSQIGALKMASDMPGETSDINGVLKK